VDERPPAAIEEPATDKPAIDEPAIDEIETKLTNLPHQIFRSGKSGFAGRDRPPDMREQATMNGPRASLQTADAPSLADRSHALTKLIIKLRWIGMEEEARCVQSLYQIAAAHGVLESGPENNRQHG
jgi:hypothetical protein